MLLIEAAQQHKDAIKPYLLLTIPWNYHDQLKQNQYEVMEKSEGNETSHVDESNEMLGDKEIKNKMNKEKDEDKMRKM